MTLFTERLPSDDQILTQKDKYCGDELMVYEHFDFAGVKFNCSLLPILRIFALDQNRLLESAYTLDTPGYANITNFVLAADYNYYKSIRIGELKNICNLELRVFDFNQLPTELRGLKTITTEQSLQEMYMELGHFVYADSSIFFESSDFDTFFKMMGDEDKDMLLPFQMSGNTGHSIQHATHKQMYAYLPIDSSILKHPMLEANLLLLKRTETTRNILKWAILCAYTKECIEPSGSTLGCTPEGRTPPGLCHRQDQSILNILIGNLEVKLQKAGRNNLIVHNSEKHPKNVKQRHQTRRAQKTSNEIANCTDKRK